MKIETKCLQCGETLIIDVVHEGEGYFLGYDTDYYGDSLDDIRDPHEIVGHFCKRCGSFLRAEAEKVGSKKIE